MISNKVKLFVFQLLLLFAENVFAVDLSKYYANANGKKQKDLKTALSKIVGNPSTKSYSSLWDWYYDTDRLSDNQVVDRYSNTKRYFTERGSQPSGMNKEHGIPQSWWGGGTSGIGSDLQHVMPSESDANSQKSNYGMGVVTNQTWTNGSIKVGKGTAGNNGTVQLWEPADEWKGDFARAYFYIVTAYEEKSLVQKEGANTMQSNAYPKLQPWAYELYLKWSQEDPVDDLERKRNETVYGIQGNRNPFIDYEGLEQYIWGDHQNVAFNASNYENPYGDNTNPTLKTPDVNFAAEEKVMEVGDTYTQEVQTNSSGEVTYESSNSSVASVDKNTGLVTALSAGQTTITATVGATNVYRAGTATYTVTVRQPGVTPKPSDGKTYVKVTERLNDWTGTYLIVYEAENVALDGGLETFDKVSNSIPVSINAQSTIDVTNATEAAEFTIAKMADGKYSVCGASGKYLGATAKKNTLESSSTPIATTISVTDGDAILTTESGYTLRFNTQNNQKRFRFYASGQEPVSLYLRAKKEVLLGDVDGDGSISISDVTALVNIILGRDNADYNHEAADVDGDGDVSISDVTALVNIILNR